MADHDGEPDDAHVPCRGVVHERVARQGHAPDLRLRADHGPWRRAAPAGGRLRLPLGAGAGRADPGPVPRSSRRGRARPPVPRRGADAGRLPGPRRVREDVGDAPGRHRRAGRAARSGSRRGSRTRRTRSTGRPPRSASAPRGRTRSSRGAETQAVRRSRALLVPRAEGRAPWRAPRRGRRADRVAAGRARARRLVRRTRPSAGGASHRSSVASRPISLSTSRASCELGPVGLSRPWKWSQRSFIHASGCRSVSSKTTR